MANTRSDSNSESIYPLSTLLTEYADNSAGLITPQTLRDLAVSCIGMAQAQSSAPSLDPSVTTDAPDPGNWGYLWTCNDGTQTNLSYVNNQGTTIQLTKGPALLSSSIILTPTTTAPIAPAEGQMYVDSSATPSQVRIFLNGDWRQLHYN